MKIVSFVRKIINKLHQRKKQVLHKHFTAYIIDYEQEGKNLRIITNLGSSRVVKNTKENQTRLNQVININKLKITDAIREYENTSKERITVLMLNILFLSISGSLVPLTFFIGNYLVFILSIFLFSFLSLTISIITIDYYVLVEEVKHLKNITGYKKENEFNIPNIALRHLKNEIK